ncbi:MAG: DUF551 domain-containing protein [Acinetobacter sp.]
MDIQKEREVFQKFCEENFDFECHEQTYFDEQTQCYENDIGEDTESINMAWMAWQAAKAQAAPEWISVQDKLPKFQQEVLILVGDEYLVAEYLPSATNEFEIQFKEGFWINGGASVVDADLWMSLPQPPKAQEPAND